jgi:hypothetical protein
MYSTFASVFLYAPFANTWARAIIVPFLLTAVWGGIRMFSIIVFCENSPPLIGFLIAPFQGSIIAVVLRCGKLLLFKIPALADWERRMKQSWKKGEH